MALQWIKDRDRLPDNGREVLVKIAGEHCGEEYRVAYVLPSGGEIYWWSAETGQVVAVARQTGRVEWADFRRKDDGDKSEKAGDLRGT